MTPYSINDLVIVTACNSRTTLVACLARSPDVVSGRLAVEVVEGASSMAAAYNRGLDATTQPLLILAHQDVYLPSGWADRAVAALNDLSKRHPDWEAAAPYGVETHRGGKSRFTAHGRVWDVAFNREFGSPVAHPQPVQSLEELLIVLRRRPHYRFDPALPHFHLYGTDIALSAWASGRGAYAIDLPVVHNARLVDSLRGGYTQAWWYMRRKWWGELPIETSCSRLSKYPWNLWRSIRAVDRRPKRTDAPLPDAVAAARTAGYE